jgi:hypothetical protein
MHKPLKVVLAGMVLAAPPGGVRAAEVTCIVAKTSLELEQPINEGRGRQTTRLISADKVLPGDEVIYTVSAAKVCDHGVEGALIDKAIPEHMRYVPDSAIAPAAEATFSIDGGFRYERPDDLKVSAPDGTQRPAAPADYTHIRWRMKRPLAPGAVVIARFRAIFE